MPSLQDLARREMERLRWPPTIPEGTAFDVRQVHPAELDAYGVPPRPDAARSPAMLDFWERMLRPPLLWHPPKYDILPNARLLRAGSPPETTGGSAIGGLGGRWGTTRNWCGAVAAAEGGLRFERVAARWIVPTPSRPRRGWERTAPPPGGFWTTSVWIGLDGFRRFQLSLPQVGTVSRMPWSEYTQSEGEPEAYAFAQWWVRGKPYGEIRLTDITVRPGDEIYAMLVLRDGGENVSFHVTNRTLDETTHLRWVKGAYQLAEAKPGEAVLDLNQLPRTDAPAEGRYAVWCTERPGIMPKDLSVIDLDFNPDPYRLPDFNPVPFGEALAEMRDPKNPGAPPVPRDLTAARWLRVTGAAEDAGPPRSQILASPGAPVRAPRTFTVMDAR